MSTQSTQVWRTSCTPAEMMPSPVIACQRFASTAVGVIWIICSIVCDNTSSFLADSETRKHKEIKCHFLQSKEADHYYYIYIFFFITQVENMFFSPCAAESLRAVFTEDCTTQTGGRNQSENYLKISHYSYYKHLQEIK